MAYRTYQAGKSLVRWAGRKRQTTNREEHLVGHTRSLISYLACSPIEACSPRSVLPIQLVRARALAQAQDRAQILNANAAQGRCLLALVAVVVVRTPESVQLAQAE